MTSENPKGGPLRDTGTKIQVSRPIHAWLVAQAAAKQRRTGRQVTISEVLEDLRDLAEATHQLVTDAERNGR